MTKFKVITLISVILFLSVGCAAIKQSTADAKACLADPACRAEAVSKAESVKGQAIAVSGVSPVPLSTNAVGGAAYGIALLIALIRGGKKKRESGS